MRVCLRVVIGKPPVGPCVRPSQGAPQRPSSGLDQVHGATPTYGRHGPRREVGILDALAPPVGSEDGLLPREAAIGIATGDLPQ